MYKGEYRETFIKPDIGTEVFAFEGSSHFASVVDRPNRFVVNVNLDGRNISCHLHDPGRLRELIFPGNRVIIRKTKGLKTAFSITAAYDSGEWVLTDTRIHSDIARKFLPEDIIPETRIGNHRIDFRHGNTLIEVKGCTLLNGEIAIFPDAPTRRGLEHLQILREHVRNGGNAAIMVLVFRKNARCFLPNQSMDPEFSEEFNNCIRDGVRTFIPRLLFENNKIFYGGNIEVCDSLLKKDH
jgi:sugar fermentation stimulation protein A